MYSTKMSRAAQNRLHKEGILFMWNKFLAVTVLSGILMSCNVSSAAHIHAFPSIDRPDKDLILIRENFKEDMEDDNRLILSDGTIGYRLFFLEPGQSAGTGIDYSPYLYFYIPAKDGVSSRIMRLENKSDLFSHTRAVKIKDYTEKEDKQVPGFLEVLDKCYNDTIQKLNK